MQTVEEKMNKKLELNAITGEVIERDYTEGETEQRTKDLAKYAALAEAQAAKATARQALLEKLGITEEEAQLLLGGI
jgi:hypothetical protein